MRTSCIRLRAKSRVAVLYEDLLEICDGNMLAAMLLSILIYWTDTKISKKEENLWIWKTHQDFQEDLMFDKPGMKPPHRTTIKTALDLLKGKGFVQVRKNPKMALDQTKQYLVEQQVIQNAIDRLPAIVGKTTLESRKSDNGLLENRHCTSENQQCNVEISTSNTNDYTTVITESVITEGEESVSADASTPPPSLTSHSQEISEVREAVNETLEVVETARQATIPIASTTTDQQGDTDGLYPDNSDSTDHHFSPASHSNQQAQRDQGPAAGTANRQRGDAPRRGLARTPQTVAAATRSAESGFTPGGEKTYNAWCSLFLSPPEESPKTIDCANALYPLLRPWCDKLQLDEAGLLKIIMKWMNDTDKKKYYARGIALCDVRRDFEYWQSAKTEELNKAAKPPPTRSGRRNFDEELRNSRRDPVHTGK